ncbi:VOC family protein [Labilibaculum antarcticum]|nr:VOC family protein [Labilibaculum antarcticum]
MKQSIAHVTLVVRDYDQAIEFYTNKLQFDLLEDLKMSEDHRWVLIAPKGSSSCSIMLEKAIGKEQESRIGNQTGGSVFMILQTDNFERDYKHLLDNKIRITRESSTEVYGKVCVFADLYGNLWDLIEPVKKED